MSTGGLNQPEWSSCVAHRKSPGWLPAAEAPDDLPLGEDGESLVQPEVLKVVIGDQVAYAKDTF